ncbi:MAG: adenylate/guanylate cyclase domain-containing protein [Geminicoccaceae bacterium]
MTGRLAVPERGHITLFGRWVRFVVGPPTPPRIPERVQRAIREEQEAGEILVSLIQLAAIAVFGIVYTIAPKAFPPEVPFEPVPWTLAAYTGFTLLRLWLAWRRRLPAWFLALSVIVDITVLMLTIWSFHLQYQQPAPIYLKATTLMYVFILIALRTLRFEPGLVLLAGTTGAVGWLVVVAYAVLADGGAAITHSFAAYAMSYEVLLGAEVDKVLSILIVTAILALALLRARKLLIRATTEQLAASELARFFAPEVAGRIRAMEAAIEPGQADARDAAILMIDLRSFTLLSHRLEPHAVMELLSAYQSRMVAEIDRHGGSVDKFMGDGILASFGATRPSASYAADGLRAVGTLIDAARRWAIERQAAGLPAPAIGAALATGQVMFGAIGDRSRLEYTVIGDPVNLAAKLEKHTKAEGVAALCTAESYRLALRQGYAAGDARLEQRQARTVAGVDGPLDLVAFV